MTTFTRSISMPRPAKSVDTRMRAASSLKLLYLAIRSGWDMREWRAMEGKLESTSSLFNCFALFVEFTKITAWLNSRASNKSMSFASLSPSVSLTKYCCRPCRVSFDSSSTNTSIGSCMNFRHSTRMSLGMVAENIITCLSCGVATKIFCTVWRMSVSSILSHSSSTKCFVLPSFKLPRCTRSYTRPGVPTMMLGFSSAISFSCCSRRMPPYNTRVFTPGMYLEKRLNSLPIWKANSRTWHNTTTETCPSTGSSW
mmetsp:Transcript_90194/g.125322  ORF Transcript_90194/g.125322 Transcript_90194/m.125322 type:complete len:255 (-) Transcript_90194:347-1111(-)